MRLIDADRLLSDYSYLFMDIYGKECSRMFVGVVNQAQTIDVGEELEKIWEEIEGLAFDYIDFSADKELVVDLENIKEVIDKHIAELKGENR